MSAAECEGEEPTWDEVHSFECGAYRPTSSNQHGKILRRQYNRTLAEHTEITLTKITVDDPHECVVVDHQRDGCWFLCRWDVRTIHHICGLT